ncbi:MAG: hypothetical protein M3295_09120 [Chloroflexota bacterium]|nr:hypothetical protein [Chloroflexota bacterium]
MKLRQQRTLLLQLPTVTQPDVLQIGGATSAGRSWPPPVAAACAGPPQ